ncbi:HCLS1-associated protein X-1-like [Athalia rosae]|uniref:HCLS1-associated protein X-1-like n=1 Tax=Athalia rosae TaxID=37344 RepID=UPI0020342F53|nr:HCLS1-associated protein X-1-like [Athalia rosae]
MSFYNFFRDIFGFGRREPPNYGFEDQSQHKDEFRNPIWQTDEDEDDDNDDFRHPGVGNFGSGRFNVYTDPFEITRYFETQMDSMLKNFFGFSHEGIMSPFGNPSEDRLQHPLPIEPPRQSNLRDEVLKPGYETLEPQNHLPPEKQKLDIDLDGRITSDELSKVWKDPSSLQSTDSYANTPRQRPFVFHSFGQSVSTKIIRKPDGTIEQYRTVKDSNGNEETTITHQIGDKTRTVIIKKDKNGEKSETETINSPNLFNPELSEPFENSTDDHRDTRNPLNYFPWQKLFGPNPKL